MSKLKMMAVLVAAVALASCGEFSTQPVSGSENGTQGRNYVTAQTARTIETGVTEFHVKAMSSTAVEFTWKMEGRCDGFEMPKVGVNYIAVFPPPYDIPDPEATSKIEVGFAPDTQVGMWQITPYTNVNGVRVRGTTVRLHPKEAATHTFP
jgi:hypothetical protein